MLSMITTHLTMFQSFNSLTNILPIFALYRLFHKLIMNLEKNISVNHTTPTKSNRTKGIKINLPLGNSNILSSFFL